jgi:hypothetical protein
MPAQNRPAAPAPMTMASKFTEAPPQLLSPLGPPAGFDELDETDIGHLI